MRDPHPTGLLDDYLMAIGPRLRLALTATASRNRSIGARQLLARAALGESGTSAELLTAARAGDRRWLRRIRRRADASLLAALAQTMALQEQLPTDRDDALALYELIRRAYGASVLTPANQALHAQLAFAYQGVDRTRRLMRDYKTLGEHARTGLTIDQLNPFLQERPVEPWLNAFRALLPGPAVEMSDEQDKTPFDRLSTAVAERTATPHRISVVVTAFKPDQGLITAVRSILAQSWANVEIVIVDDASPPEYDEILGLAVAMGDRIRLVKLPVNGGTYAARNAGLDACGGEFVAFQDSDDWSHPRRLETQVAPLIEDRKLVATTTDGLAVTDRLLLTRPGVRTGRFNPSSLLFRRTIVMQRLGYFDPVRKAADSEYIGRIQAVFGPRAVHHIEEPLALIRLSADSLSRSEIKPHWMHPARTAYMSAYQRWHQLIGAGVVPAYRPADGRDRPFAVPGHLLGADPTEEIDADVVMVADWRFLESTQRTAVDELRALAEEGLRVAVVHIEQYRAAYLKRVPLATPLQDLINAGAVTRLAWDQRVRAGLVLVRQAAVLQFAEGVESGIRGERVVVVADRAPARAGGADRRYEPATCTAHAGRLFGADPEWIAVDPSVRSFIRTQEPDLPAVIAPVGWVGERAGASPGPVVAGVDLCDAANWPADVAETLAVCRRLPEADIRVRLPDRPRDEVKVDLPRGWIGFETADLGPRPFLHQLDFYLHFPPEGAAEWSARPPLEAAAMGCIVVMPERFADWYGDAAVYCAPSEVAPLISRYRADRALFAGQSRRAREVVARGNAPGLLVERILAMLPVTTSGGPALPKM